MSISTELTLRTTPIGLRVCQLPVKEIANLYTRTVKLDGTKLSPGDANPLAKLKGGLYDIDLVADLSAAKQLELSIRSRKLVYDVATSTLTFDKRKHKLPDAKKLILRIVVDNCSIDIFAGEHGLLFITNMIPGGNNAKTLSAEVKGGSVTLEKLQVHELKSIWKK